MRFRYWRHGEIAALRASSAVNGLFTSKMHRGKVVSWWRILDLSAVNTLPLFGCRWRPGLFRSEDLCISPNFSGGPITCFERNK